MEWSLGPIGPSHSAHGQVFLGLRPFELNCVSICYINYSRKLLKVFISPTDRSISLEKHLD